ncbi:MAG: elongation factor P maturation arginine rhamnosyltransferase EarP [Proteobacteria bacterium]|nr:elongation factor P maturation arginine rhamnosyltransferase EarP [Pseudomonadota bacterium]
MAVPAACVRRHAVTTRASPHRYAIFCRVVDNHGDAGVCWRLARLLAGEHGLDVTLWIDQRAALAAFVPAAATAHEADGIALRDWTDAEARYDDAPDVVIEGFGCGLPAPVLDALERRRHVWLVLEYLSAEPWVDGFHGLPSPHPSRPLTRWFFFPGFTAATGGLLRERAVAAPTASLAAGQGLDVTVFTYDNAALGGLLDAWRQSASPVRVAVPEGVASATLAGWLGEAPGRAGREHQRDALALRIVEWTDQRGFDARLAASGFNLVRGEDSFVRAQWAARPFLWHIYRQDGDAHRVKLDAFLARYLAGATPVVADAVRALWAAFEREDPPATAAAWPAFAAAHGALDAHARDWAATLARLPEQAACLVEFAKKRYN